MNIIGMISNNGKLALVGLYKVEYKSVIASYVDTEMGQCKFVRIGTDLELKSYDMKVREQSDEFISVVFNSLREHADLGWITLCINGGGKLQLLTIDTDYFDNQAVLCDAVYGRILSVEPVSVRPCEVEDADKESIKSFLIDVGNRAGWVNVAKSWCREIKEEMEEEELEEQYV